MLLLGVLCLALLLGDELVEVVECRHQVEQFDEALRFLLALAGNDLPLRRG